MDKQSIFLEPLDLKGFEVKGWKVGVGGGTVEWYMIEPNADNEKEKDFLILATPQYNEENEVPFEFNDGGQTQDETHFYSSLRFNKYQSKNDQKIQYLAVIAFIIEKIIEGNGLPNDEEINKKIKALNDENYAALNKHIDRATVIMSSDNVQLAVDEVFLAKLKEFAEASDGLMNAIDQLSEEEFAKLSRKYPFEKKFEKVNKKIQRWFVRSWEL